MTDEEIARQVLMEAVTRTSYGLAKDEIAMTRNEFIRVVSAACDAARQEGRAEVNREWADAEIERGEYE